MFEVSEKEISKIAITIDGETIEDSQYAKGIKVEKEHKDIYDLFKSYLKKNNLEMPMSEEDFYSMVVAAHAKENSKDYYPDEAEPYKLVPVESGKEANKKIDPALALEDATNYLANMDFNEAQIEDILQHYSPEEVFEIPEHELEDFVSK